MLLVEKLEGRELMSGSPCNVTCTPGADRVAVTLVGTKVNVSVNGIVKANVDVKLVSSLVLDTCGGADAIEIAANVHLPVTIKSGSNVFCNVPVSSDAVFINAGLNVNVLAKLGLSAGLKIAATANVDAAVGLLAKLQIGAGGALCTSSGVKVDVNACLGLLANLGVKTGVAVDVNACVNLCGLLGIKPLVSLNLKTAAALNAQLGSCEQQLVSIGAKLDLGLTLGGLLSLKL